MPPPTDSPEVAIADNDSIPRLVRYGKAFLIPMSLLLAIVFAFEVFSRQTSVIYLIESVAMLAMLCSTAGPRVLRIGILIAMTVNVASILANENYLGQHSFAISSFPPVALIACLAATLLIEFSVSIRSRSPDEKSNHLLWMAVVFPFAIYAIGIPVVNAIIHSFDDSTAKAARDPGWSILNEVSLRVAKYGVFAVATYLGACFGSFLNVVAHSLPRGESIGLRDSSCPKCKTKISRIDNLPIFSYLNLGGRCRSCKTKIPIRYLTVELIAAFVFGSLFLYQLVTGCANIPNFKSFIHIGVVWMVLHPQWPVIGIYLLHALFMTGLLTMALVELDRQKLKWWHLMTAILVPVLLAAIFPALHPVQLVEKFPALIPWDESSVVYKALGPFVSALLGFLIGGTVAFSPASRNWQMTATAFAICGAVLGWQAMLQVSVVFAMLMLAGFAIPQLRKAVSGRSISVLLVAVFLHHPFWKVLFQLW